MRVGSATQRQRHCPTVVDLEEGRWAETLSSLNKSEYGAKMCDTFISIFQSLFRHEKTPLSSGENVKARLISPHLEV